MIIGLQYDFHKSFQNANSGEFEHQYFIRDRPDLLAKITRKANNGAVASKKRSIQQQSQDPQQLDAVPFDDLGADFNFDDVADSGGLQAPTDPAQMNIKRLQNLPADMQDTLKPLAYFNRFTLQSENLLKEVVQHRVMSNDFERRLRLMEGSVEPMLGEQGDRDEVSPPSITPKEYAVVEPMDGSPQHPMVHSSDVELNHQELEEENQLLRRLVVESTNKQTIMNNKIEKVIEIMCRIATVTPNCMKYGLSLLNSGVAIDDIPQYLDDCAQSHEKQAKRGSSDVSTPVLASDGSTVLPDPLELNHTSVFSGTKETLQTVCNFLQLQTPLQENPAVETLTIQKTPCDNHYFNHDKICQYSCLKNRTAEMTPAEFNERRSLIEFDQSIPSLLVLDTSISIPAAAPPKVNMDSVSDEDNDPGPGEDNHKRSKRSHVITQHLCSVPEVPVPVLAATETQEDSLPLAVASSAAIVQNPDDWSNYDTVLKFQEVCWWCDTDEFSCLSAQRSS